MLLCPKHPLAGKAGANTAPQGSHLGAIQLRVVDLGIHTLVQRIDVRGRRGGGGGRRRGIHGMEDLQAGQLGSAASLDCAGVCRGASESLGSHGAAGCKGDATGGRILQAGIHGRPLHRPLRWATAHLCSIGQRAQQSSPFRLCECGHNAAAHRVDARPAGWSEREQLGAQGSCQQRPESCAPHVCRRG